MTSTHSWPATLTTLLTGGNLTVDEATRAMTEVISGQATSAQLAAFLIALRAKGEAHPIEKVGRKLRELFAWRPQDKDYTDGSAAR